MKRVFNNAMQWQAVRKTERLLKLQLAGRLNGYIKKRLAAITEMIGISWKV